MELDQTLQDAYIELHKRKRAADRFDYALIAFGAGNIVAQTVGYEPLVPGALSVVFMISGGVQLYAHREMAREAEAGYETRLQEGASGVSESAPVGDFEDGVGGVGL